MRYKNIEMGYASIGSLETKSGRIETPTFFPVHDLGFDGGYHTPKYWEVFPEVNQGMFNASLIRLHSNSKLHQLLEIGLSEYTGFNGVSFVDSGGYVYTKYKLDFSQEEILAVQEQINCDIASTLDYPIYLKNSFSNQNIIKSIENAKRALQARTDPEMLLYASIHGYDPVILRNIIRHLEKFGDFDGYALGSLMKGYSNYRLLIDLIITAKREIGDKSLHVYGLSGSVVIPLLCYLGVDSVDSSSYIIAAANKMYIIPNKNRANVRYIAKDLGEVCPCKICQNNSNEAIISSRELLSFHNIWALNNELQCVKQAMARDQLKTYLITRFSNNPWANKALKYAQRRMKMGLPGGN